MRRAVRFGHDVTMLQLTSPDEQELGYGQQIELEDLESGERRLADATALAPSYRADVAAFLERSRREAVAAAIDHALISVATPPERALRDYLLQRARRPGTR